MTASEGQFRTITELYQRYGRSVYAVAYRLLGDVRLAEEATQQTFVEAWPNIAGVEAQRDAGSWLTAIAVRTANDIQRHNGRPPSANQARPAWHVRFALDALPDGDRDLIRLRHHAKLTDAEIAECLGVSIDVVRGRLARAHRLLADSVLGRAAEPNGPRHT